MLIRNIRPRQIQPQPWQRPTCAQILFPSWTAWCPPNEWWNALRWTLSHTDCIGLCARSWKTLCRTLSSRTPSKKPWTNRAWEKLRPVRTWTLTLSFSLSIQFWRCFFLFFKSPDKFNNVFCFLLRHNKYSAFLKDFFLPAEHISHWA